MSMTSSVHIAGPDPGYNTAGGTGIVLVTGASGYIASQITKLLLTKGYRVRGTVRSLSNKVKVKPLLDLCPNSAYPLELVEADLNVAESWDRAVQGCTYVLHVASPYPSEAPRHENDVLHPAIHGTLSVLQACHMHRVKRVVVTSSISTIFGDIGESPPPGKVYTEEDWTNPVPSANVYVRSKTFAERAAWNYHAQLPPNERFELAVVNPSFVFGPLVCGGLGTSALIVKKILNREVPMVPRINFPVVDVRDVAVAHLQAMTLPQAAGNRHIVHSGYNLWMKDMADILEREFHPQGYDIPTKVAPFFLVRLLSLFDKSVAYSLSMNGIFKTCDDTKTKVLFGIDPIHPDQMLNEMAYSLIDRGFVHKTRRYRRRPSVYSNQ